MNIRISGLLSDNVIYDVGNQSSGATKCDPIVADSASLAGGYKGGCLTMKRWEEINDFCLSVDCGIIFTLNQLIGRNQVGIGMRRKCVEFGPPRASDSTDIC